MILCVSLPEKALACSYVSYCVKFSRILISREKNSKSDFGHFQTEIVSKESFVPINKFLVLIKKCMDCYKMLLNKRYTTALLKTK